MSNNDYLFDGTGPALTPARAWHFSVSAESDRLLRCREMTLCAITDQSAVQQIPA